MRENTNFGSLLSAQAETRLSRPACSWRKHYYRSLANSQRLHSARDVVSGINWQLNFIFHCHIGSSHVVDKYGILRCFPVNLSQCRTSAAGAAALRDLPSLVRKMLAQSPPSRADILDAYSKYLAPFSAASPNNWSAKRTSDDIDGYVAMIDALETYLSIWDNASSHGTLVRMER